jgi:hypothetical protein
MAGDSIIRDNPEVDFVVQGEGEETLLDIVRKTVWGGQNRRMCGDAISA